MSHLIKEHDRVQSTIGTEWHGLAEVVESIQFNQSPIDYIVKNCAVTLPNGEASANWQMLMTDGIEEPLAITKDSYHVIQNERVFETVTNSLEGLDYKIVNVGSLDNKKKIFLSIELGETASMTIAGDKFKNYLNFASSHDGSMSFEVFDSMTRIVCNNTLQASRNSKGKLKFNVRHTKNHELRIVDIEKTINQLFENRLAMANQLERIAEKPLTLKQAENVIAGFVNVGSKQSVTSGKKILDLFQNGKGNSGKTVYDLLNGVTEYYTHFDKGDISNRITKQVSSSEFGSGARKKSEFASIVLNDSVLNALADKGERLLEESQVNLLVA